MTKYFHQIAESEKTINESPNPIAEAEKIIAKIIKPLSNEHTNKDQFTYRAS